LENNIQKGKNISLLAVGELLVDFIGTAYTESLFDSATFIKLQGGSPANLAANMARLGSKVALVAAVGQDKLGDFLCKEVEKTGLDIKYIAQVPEPSTIVVVSRSKATPDFIAYRHADTQLQDHHLPNALLSQVAVFHTTCFALSKNPSQTSILKAAEKASSFGAILSIDANYAPSIWPNTAEAWQVLGSYLKHGAWIKLSEDDAQRLFGEGKDANQIFEILHKLGAALVCYTLGAKGAVFSYNFGENQYPLPAKQLTVVDSTGAGDAFWSGFLTARLAGASIENCAMAAQNMAAKKLTVLGPLPAKIDISEILKF
jgi:sugar/nucleoside kinase (ribokinase family)